MFVGGDRACEPAGTAALITVGVPEHAKTGLGELTLTSVPVSKGLDKASGATSHWCGSVDDPHRASEVVVGEDEG